MPLYSYKCAKCKKIYEVQVPLSQYGKDVKCPHCKKRLEKLISAPLFKVN